MITNNIYWDSFYYRVNKHLTGVYEVQQQSEGFDTNWDGHHDGGVVGQGGQFTLSEKKEISFSG